MKHQQNKQQLKKNTDVVSLDRQRKRNYVFVYGSLRKGFGNHRLLANNSDFIMRTQTVKRYKAVSFGGFPAVYKAPPLRDEVSEFSPLQMVAILNTYRPVVGEIYKVSDSCLEGPLDSLEGHPHWYRRERVQVMNFAEPVWMYIMRPSRDRSLPHRKSPLLQLDEHGSYCWANSYSVQR